MPPKYGGGNPCKRCSKTVYSAEERKDSEGGFWHKECFACKECGKKLDSTTLNMHEGTIKPTPIPGSGRPTILEQIIIAVNIPSSSISIPNLLKANFSNQLSPNRIK